MEQDTDKRKKLIRNSTVEFLIFTGQAGEQSIEARYEDESVWLTQKLMAQLFDVTVPTINEHLKNILADGELKPEAVIRNFLITALKMSQPLKISSPRFKTNYILQSMVILQPS